MMPMALASRRMRLSFPAVSGSTTGISASDTRNVAKMPNCAAAPKKIIDGSLSRGEKSIIAPTAMKIRIGNSSLAMPALNSTLKNPLSPSTLAAASPLTASITGGRLARIAPKPMGKSSVGS